MQDFYKSRQVQASKHDLALRLAVSRSSADEGVEDGGVPVGRLRGDVPEEEPARSRSSLARRHGTGGRARGRPGQGEPRTTKEETGVFPLH